jgi:hypothetical protein
MCWIERPRAGISLRQVYCTFTRSHRRGSGQPLVCLHGFTGTWRTWELVLPVLERHHDVLAPTYLATLADDRLLPWPSSATRFRSDWLAHADWVELDGIGHCPRSTSRSRRRS